MLKIMGEHYFIDLDAIEKYVDMTVQNVDTTGKTETAINIIKYETVKLMLDVVLSESDDTDDKLGIASANNLTLPFKLI